MFRNLFLAALVAALCAGLVTSVVQHFRLTPMIFAAEAFEGAAPEAHSHDNEAAEGEAVAGHSHDEDEWMPQDGLERSLFTAASNIFAAAGFALILGAASLAFNLPITASTGLAWGVAGFAIFTLAPSFGVPPGLPTMPIAETFARQLWWAGTAAATGAAILMVAKQKALWAVGAAIVLATLPHLVGAPQPAVEPSAIPPGLAAGFASAVIVNGAIFFVVLGVVFGLVADRLRRPAALPAGAPA